MNFQCKVEAIDFEDMEVQNKHIGSLIDVQYPIIFICCSCRRYVVFRNGVKLNDSSLKMLAEQSPHLKELHLAGAAGAKGFSNDGLACIVDGCKELTHLELCGISKRTKSRCA